MKYFRKKGDIHKYLRKLTHKCKYWLGNNFATLNGSESNNTCIRKQFSHIMSAPLLKYLGYTMAEFGREFINKGFPKIYNDVTNIHDILDMYRRDITCNTNLS